MMVKCLLIFFIWAFSLRATICETTMQKLKPAEYPLNDTGVEISNNSSDYSDDQLLGPADSHEAMNNREFAVPHREKRSYEFLVGLINNNSKYEVIRSDPEMHRNPIKGISEEKTENKASEPTHLLLELLTKIVTYPDRWKQIHNILKTLDADLNASKNIIKYQYLPKTTQNLEYKRKFDDKKTVNELNDSSYKTTNKWPTFEDMDDTSSTTNRPLKLEEKNFKNFEFHKVTGTPAHFRKNSTAYIAVSSVSSSLTKSQESSEDYLLENELHQLKPWKNKPSSSTTKAKNI